MSERYKPKKGDRVRVVLEGEVSWASGLTDSFDTEKSVFHHENIVSVEKIEPPVTVFKPGQTVRSAFCGDLIYSIGEGGYYAHHHREWLSHEQAHTSPDYFTSDRYELVALS